MRRSIEAGGSQTKTTTKYCEVLQTHTSDEPRTKSISYQLVCFEMVIEPSPVVMFGDQQERCVVIGTREKLFYEK